MGGTKVTLLEDSEKYCKNEKEAEARGFRRSTSKQITLAFLVFFSSLAPSMSLGFSAIAIPVLTNLSTDQLSWFASIASLATPFACFFSGPVSDKYGRRTAIALINITGFIGWLVIALAYYWTDYQYLILLIGRLLTGMSTGLASVPATVYVAEISCPKLRGVLTTWNSIAFAFGILIVYLLGYILQDNWGAVSLITAIFPCVGMSFVVFMVPESPAWLVGKHRIDEARESLRRIFGTPVHNAVIELEIEELIRQKGGVKPVTETRTLVERFKSKIRHLIKSSSLKPLVLIFTYFFFMQFTGVFSIVFYCIDIVRAAGIELDPYVTIVIIGLVRLVTSIATSIISKRVGRRPLSIVSGAGMSLTMLGLGVYLTLINQGKVPEDLQHKLKSISFVLLILYFISSTLGFLPLPFAMSAELFPTKIRGTAAALGNSFSYLCNFVVVKLHSTMLSNLGNDGLFYFFGGMSVAGTIFVTLFLPETRGKTLEEIQEHFIGRSSKKQNNRINDNDYIDANIA